MRKERQKTEPKPEGCTFVLILWQVPCQGDEAEWRWRVRCLRSGRERCFRRLGDVLAFLAEESGCSPPR